MPTDGQGARRVGPPPRHRPLLPRLLTDVPEVIKVEVPAAVAPALGAKYRIVGKLLGRSVESSYEITAFDRDRGFGGTIARPCSGSPSVIVSSPTGQGLGFR